MNVEKYTDEFLERLVDSLRAYSAEQTWFELKTNCADVMRIGKYLSGLSNAALLANQPFGYLVYGVDDVTHEVEGTNFDPLREKTRGKDKGEELVNYLQRGLRDSAVSYDVYSVKVRGKRVCIFEIEAAKIRPVEFYGEGFCRVGSTLTELKKNVSLEREIYNHLTSDWSARTIPGVGLEAIDKEALAFARKQYTEKYKDASFANQIEKWDDWTFLEKAKLAIEGRLTFAAIVLIGKEEAEHWISPYVARITWNLMAADGRVRDYVHFKIPLILSVGRVFDKIRNLNLREMPDGTLFPRTLKQYDNWVFREALHNCVAHQDYARRASIVVSEYEDKVELCNVGNFAPGSVEAVLKNKGRPRHYPNRQLVDAMVELKMIDTAGMGIHTMFEKQRANAMPLPDYEFTNGEVCVSIVGKVIDARYSNLLLQKSDVTLEQVLLLDKIQKGRTVSKEEAAGLRSHGLIEGRYPKIYPTASLAAKTGDEAGYLGTRGFDTKFYKQRILEYICLKKKATLKDVYAAIVDFLPKGRTASANRRKVASLLSQTMSKREGLIKASAPRVSEWMLTETGVKMCQIGNSSCKRHCPKA